MLFAHELNYNKSQPYLKKEQWQNIIKYEKHRNTYSGSHYFIKNPEKKKQQNKRYRENNREKINERAVSYRKNNIFRKISANLRSRLNSALKNNSKK